MAKKLDSDIPSFDSDLDFDFNTDISGELNQEAKKKDRGVVTSVTRGITSGMIDTAKSPSFIKATLKKALPPSYAEIADAAEEIASGTYELYDQSLRELKPRLGSIARKLDAFVPEGQKTLKNLSGKIANALDGGRNTEYAATESQDEQAIATALGAIFNQQKQYTQISEKKDILRDTIDQKRHRQSASFLSSIEQNTSIQAQYTTNVTQAYQKKMLELQLRGYIAQKEYYAQSARFNQIFQAQYEAIVKNTAMPEFQKITNSERFVDNAKTRFINSLYGEGSMVRKGMDKLKKTGAEFVKGLQTGLDTVDMSLDQAVSAKESIDSMNAMLIDMGEPPLTKSEMLGAMAGGNIMEYIRDRLSKTAREKLSKNKKFTEALGKMARMAVNPSGALAALRGSDSWNDKINDYGSKKGKGYRFLDFILGHFAEDSPEKTFKGGGNYSDLDGPSMGFSNKAHASLVDVIPGYLAGIQREITILRTGNENTPLQVYDFKRRDFVSDKNMAGRIVKDLIREARGSSSRYAIEQTSRKFTNDTELPEAYALELKLFLSKIARISNMEYTPENIRNTDAYENLSPIVKAVVDNKLDKIDKSEDKEVETYALSKDIVNIRAGFPSMEKSMDEYVRAGYGDQLAKLGLVNRNKEGDYERDEEAFAKFLEKYGIGKSDINVKEAIKEMNPGELMQAVKNRFMGKKDDSFVGPQPESMMDRLGKKWNPRAAYDGIKKTKLYSWMYKNGEGDPGEHYGPMAQELNKNMGESAAPTGKKIDLVSMNGATMAAIKHLGTKVEELGSGKGTSPLIGIKKDTAQIVKLLHSHGKGYGKTLKGSRRAKASQEDQSWFQGNDYTSLLGNMVRSVTKLGTQIGSDVFSAAGRVFKGAKDNVAKPVIDYVQKSWNDKDHPVRKGLGTMFEKASKLAGDVMDFSGKVVNEHLPAGWKKIKDFATNAYEEISKRLNVAKDLYLPGGTEPVIRAIKLRTGFYRDSKTGEPIFTMDKLLSCKNDIVDSTGNIILSVEERASGLLDAYGDKVKTSAMNLLDTGIGAAFYLKDKVTSGLQVIKDQGLKAFGKFKDKAKDKWDKLDSSNFGSFGGKYLKEGYQVWVDIRDILLGDADKVRERLNKKDEGKSFFDAGSATSTEETDQSSDPSIGPMQPDLDPKYSGGSSGGLFGSIGGFFGKARERYNAKREANDTFVGPMPRRSTMRDRYQGWKESAKNSRLGSQVGDQIERLKSSRIGQSTSGTFGRVRGSKLGQIAGRGFGRLKGFGATALGMAGNLASSFFGNQGEEANTPREETSATDPNRAKELAEGKERGLDWSAPKGKIAQGQRAWNDKDGDGDADGSIEDRRAKQEELAASRKKKAAEADLTARYKNEKGFFQSLLASAAGLFGTISSGAAGIFDLVSGGLSAIPGIGKIFGAGGIAGKAVGAIGTGLKAAASLGTTGLLAGGKIALAGAAKAAGWAAFTAVPAIASAAATVLGGALTAIGSVLSSPVILGAAAIGLAGYGIYKLYKHAVRNDASDLDRIRLRQYGVSRNTNEDQYNHLFYTLEAYLCDGRVAYEGGQAKIIDKNVDPKHLAEIFKIDEKDTEHGEAFARWYSKRFKPFFLTHLTALYAVDPTKELKQISSLTPAQQVKYLEAVGFESGPYNEDISPIKGIDSLETDNSLVKESIRILIEKASAAAQKEGKKIGLPAVSTAGKEDASGSAKGDHLVSLRERERQEELKRKTATQSSNKEDKPLAPFVGEDGPRPEIPAQLAAKENAAPGSLTMAPGAPLAGHGGLQYLKLGKGVNIDNMHQGTLKMLLGMAEEYGQKTGKSIQVNDGFRSFEQQASLHRKYPNKAAPPGRSLHEFGLAVDVNSADANALEELGLLKKYGFTRPVGGEPWHMEPAGIQRNIQLARTDPAQRDVMVDASFFRGGGGYGTSPGATKYRRNHDLAMKLLDLPGKTAKETIAASMPDGKAVSMPSQQTTAVAANDAVATPDKQTSSNVFALSDKGSTSKSLPTPSEVDTKKQAASEDYEGKQESSTGELASSSAGGDIKEQIAKNARKAGGDPNLMLAFAAVESDMNPNAKANTSSASGLFQFTRATWNEQLAKHGSKYSLKIGASPFDVEASTILATEYLKTNLRGLSGVKPDTGLTDAYLTHFLGPGGARKLLSAPGNAIAAEILPDAAASNKSIFYQGGKALTVKEVYDGISKRLQTKVSSYGINAKTGSLTSTAGKEQSSSDSPSGFSFSQATPDVTAQGNTSQADKSTSEREMISASSNSGVFVDKRGTSILARERRESGETFAGPNTTNLQTALDKSVQIQTDQLSVLKDIFERVDPSKVAAALATALASVATSAANSEESLKDKDDRAMGRKNPAAQSSIDLKRKMI